MDRRMGTQPSTIGARNEVSASPGLARKMSLHFFVTALGEGSAAHLKLRISDRKLEVCGPGEPGPGVPLL